MTEIQIRSGREVTVQDYVAAWRVAVEINAAMVDAGDLSRPDDVASLVRVDDDMEVVERDGVTWYSAADRVSGFHWGGWIAASGGSGLYDWRLTDANVKDPDALLD